jgi:hypothetical protein
MIIEQILFEGFWLLIAAGFITISILSWQETIRHCKVMKKMRKDFEERTQTKV